MLIPLLLFGTQAKTPLPFSRLYTGTSGHVSFWRWQPHHGRTLNTLTKHSTCTLLTVTPAEFFTVLVSCIYYFLVAMLGLMFFRFWLVLGLFGSPASRAVCFGLLCWSAVLLGGWLFWFRVGCFRLFILPLLRAPCLSLRLLCVSDSPYLSGGCCLNIVLD